jgi:outer membrane protein assembly factor BamA
MRAKYANKFTPFPLRRKTLTGTMVWTLVQALLFLLLIRLPAGSARADEPISTDDQDTVEAQESTEGQPPEEDPERMLQELEKYRGVTITEIDIEGTRITKDYVIAREIWSREGKPLDPDLVKEDIIRLENLAIFGTVIVTPTPRDGGVELSFHFTEIPWLIPFPAFSWNEQNGFSVGLGLSSPNFLGRKMTLSAKALFGGTTAYSFRAANPWIAGNHLSADVLATHNIRQNKLLDFKETSDRAQLIGGVYLGQRGRLLAAIGYYGVGSDKDGITLSSDNWDDMLIAGFSLGYDSRDSWRVPHDGWRMDISPIYFGGDANSRTMNFDVRRYEPLGERHTIASGPLLSMQSGQVGVDIPSYLQYFLGGSNSIRGYKLEELGQELFGKNQFLYTLEYRYTLLPLRGFKILKWTISAGFELAGFGDAGIAWSRGQDFSLDRTRFGFGAGLRLLLPGVNMIRFDVGMSQYGDVVFNFGVNSIFEARRQRVR